MNIVQELMFCVIFCVCIIITAQNLYLRKQIVELSASIKELAAETHPAIAIHGLNDETGLFNRLRVDQHGHAICAK